MPSQEAQEKQRQEEDDAESDRKAEYTAKERDFVENILKLQTGFAVQPLGRDRLYRRYWIFSSIPGLFVEDDDEFVPEEALKPCLQNPNGSSFDINNPLAVPPKLAPSQVKPADNVVPQTHNENKDGSDKENDSMNASSLNNSVLGDANTSLNAQSANNSLNVQSANNSIVISDKPGNTDVQKNEIKENGGAIVISDDDDSKPAVLDEEKKNDPVEIETPAVKQIREWPKHKWAFYSSEEGVEELIKSLNSRGFRENALKHALLENKINVLQSITKVQANLLNIPELDDDTAEGKDKGKLKTTEWKVRGKSVTYTKQNDSAHEGLELNLREMILDLEERIHVGSLGYLRVCNSGCKSYWKSLTICERFVFATFINPMPCKF